jgi:glutamyl-tRNA synthetase
MELLEKGAAYYAFDTSEELETMRFRQQKAGIAPKYDRSTMKNQYTLGEQETKKLLDSGAPYVIRMKVPITAEIRFSDIIRGEVVVSGKDVDDQILLKSDGFPTYHLANVVDDHLMQITHVIRGEEWLPSTPKHVLLYDAFGWERPQFAHLPLLLNKDKTKLSKRQGSVAVEDFIERGYFKEAFVNFIALLGWNPTSDREIFSMDELIATFSLEKVNKAGAVFDTQKLDWMNSQYLRAFEPTDLVQRLKPYMTKEQLSKFSDDYIEKVIVLLRERIDILKDILTFGDYMFAKPSSYDTDYLQKHWKDNTLDLIKPLVDVFRNIQGWEHKLLHDETMKYVESRSVKLKDVIHPIRIMITGKSVGAGMFETMEVLGKDECLDRFDIFISKKEKGEI